MGAKIMPETNIVELMAEIHPPYACLARENDKLQAALYEYLADDDYLDTARNLFIGAASFAAKVASEHRDWSVDEHIAGIVLGLLGAAVSPPTRDLDIIKGRLAENIEQLNGHTRMPPEIRAALDRIWNNLRTWNDLRYLVVNSLDRFLDRSLAALDDETIPPEGLPFNVFEHAVINGVLCALRAENEDELQLPSTYWTLHSMLKRAHWGMQQYIEAVRTPKRGKTRFYRYYPKELV